MGYVNTVSEPAGRGTEPVRGSRRGSGFTVSNLDFIEAAERSLTDCGKNGTRSVLLCFCAAVALPSFLCQQQGTFRAIAVSCAAHTEELCQVYGNSGFPS